VALGASTVQFWSASQIPPRLPPEVPSASVTAKIETDPLRQVVAALAFSDRPDVPLKSTAGLKLMLAGTHRMEFVGTMASVCVGCEARSSVAVLPLPL
jgi:hypothetical protein